MYFQTKNTLNYNHYRISKHQFFFFNCSVVMALDHETRVRSREQFFFLINVDVRSAYTHLD